MNVNQNKLALSIEAYHLVHAFTHSLSVPSPERKKAIEIFWKVIENIGQIENNNYVFDYNRRVIIYQFMFELAMLSANYISKEK